MRGQHETRGQSWNREENLGYHVAKVVRDGPWLGELDFRHSGILLGTGRVMENH